MLSFVLLGLCAYFLISFIIELVNFGFPFGPAQWGMVALCVMFLPIMFFMAKRAIKEWKQSKEKQVEEQKKQLEELTKRRREMYLGDDYESDNDETVADGDDKTDFDE